MSARIFAISAITLSGLAALNALSAGDALTTFLAAPAEAAEAKPGAEDEGQNAPAIQDTPEAADAAQGAQTEPQAETQIPASANCAVETSFAEEVGASASEYRVLSSLQARRKEIEALAEEADTRIQLAAAAEKSVEERIAKLKQIKGEVQALLGQLGEEEEKRIAGLVSMYQAMKPDDAARILSALEPETAMMVASRLDDRALAAILSEMPTENAKGLTEQMAAQARIRPPQAAAPAEPSAEG